MLLIAHCALITHCAQRSAEHGSERTPLLPCARAALAQPLVALAVPPSWRFADNNATRSLPRATTQSEKVTIWWLNGSIAISNCSTSAAVFWGATEATSRRKAASSRTPLRCVSTKRKSATNGSKKCLCPISWKSSSTCRKAE
eukprot:scaffold3894_cov127-Isochrysis_galbana.AAC.2